ncbi:MAG: hypothetical protein K8T20_04960 [Planctomycetes bacterium]|nr:hypothetical protein [Planctomycetota bacterium]
MTQLLKRQGGTDIFKRPDIVRFSTLPKVTCVAFWSAIACNTLKFLALA